MTRKRSWIAAIVAVPALALAVPALAQDDTAPPEAAEQPSREERKADRQAAFAEALADELGLPAEDVAAALENVKERFQAEAVARRLERLQERLDAAVNDGSLSQEQADAILEAAEAGVLPGRKEHRGGPRSHGPRGFDHARPFAPDGAEPAA